MKVATKQNHALPNPEQKLFTRNAWLYSAGGVGRDMAYGLWNGFIVAFILMTKELDAAQFATISTLIVALRVFDAVNDPIMGGIIEATASKWGKFKPWILIGVITNSIILFAMFAAPIKGNEFLIFFPFAYILWDITFTMNDIGYWAMLPSLTSNEKNRNFATTLANIFAGIGAGLVMILTPILTAGEFTLTGNAPTAYLIIAAVICVLFIGCQIMVCVTVKEKKENLVVVPKSERSGIKHMLKTIKNNDQLRWTALVMFLYNLGSNILTGLMMYYVYFTFGYNGSIVSVFSIVSSALAVIIVIYPWLSKRVSRRNMVIGSMAAVTLGYTCMLISGLFWHSGDAYYLMAAFSALSMGGQTIFYMVLTVALQNTIEYNQLKTGKREEGIIFSVRPFMAKMGSAAQMAIVAIIFLALNVTDITKAISEQENLAVANPLGLPPDVIEAQKIANIKDIISGVPESTSTWLLIFMTVLPIILICAGGFIFIKKYKLDEKRYAEILAQLEESDKDCAEKLAEKKLADEEAIPMFEISGTVPPESAISYSRLEADYTRDCGKGNDSVEDGEAEAKDAVQEETGAPDDTDSN